MGKGKGSFDHWATRMAISQVVFELKGMIHEKVAREALRLAGHKLPGKLVVSWSWSFSGLTRVPLTTGQWDFIKKGEPAMVGITSLKNTTLEELKRPRKKPVDPPLKAAKAASAGSGLVSGSVPGSASGSASGPSA
jgi:hypothetical protein